MKTLGLVLASLLFILSNNQLIGQPVWHTQDCPIEENLVSVSFYDTLNGWVVSENGVVLRTHDGGKNWEIQNELDNLFATKVFFINEDIGWISGYSEERGHGRLLYTDDEGENWTSFVDSTKILFNDVFFIDENTGWAAGYDIEEDTINYIMLTEDGGNTWKRQMENMFLNGAMLNISFRDSQDGNICGTGGFFVGTSDKGEHWWLSIFHWEIDLKDLCNAGDKYGCMVGSGGKVYFTKDKWSNSTDYDLPFDDTLRAISGLDNLKFWAVGDNGSIVYMAYSPIMYMLFTTDQSVDTLGRLNDVVAIDDNHVWAVGETGAILHFGIKSAAEPIGLIDLSESAYRVFPNPTENLLTIESDYFGIGDAVLYNMEGKPVYTVKLSFPGFIDISRLSSGMYILELRNEHAVVYDLIMKK